MVRLKPENARDRLLSLVRFGKVTPAEAEAEARARGWPPFERQPPLPKNDPLQEPRWSLVMAVAWIAWRDSTKTREQASDWRSESTHWIWRKWNQPVAGGTKFVTRSGWFLEQWREATTVRLSILEGILIAKSELPETAKMSVHDAEKQLWRALSERRLVAEALNEAGKPVDVPEREWAFLKLFEDGKQDCLKYDALDRREPYKAIKFRRDDLMRIWPTAIQFDANLSGDLQLDQRMIQPMLDQGAMGYVPLSVAILWIATNSGSEIGLLTTDGWSEAVRELWPLICSEEIELIGQRASGGLTSPLPGSSLTLVQVRAPISHTPLEIILRGPAYISSCVYFDFEQWREHFNDKLSEAGQSGFSWSHLQVRKAEILSKWPKPQARIVSETECKKWLVELMLLSPNERPKARPEYLADAQNKFPGLGRNQFNRAWERAIEESKARAWGKAGRPKLNHPTD